MEAEWYNERVGSRDPNTLNTAPVKEVAMPRNATTAPTICSVDGCESNARKLGLCVKHYERLRIHGDVNYRQWDAVTPEMRFWSKVKKSLDPNGCWEWTGATSAGGYGQMGLERKIVYTHRFSYEFHKGPIPEGMSLDHLCRNTKCCNPDHLEPVTHKENIRRALEQTHCLRGHPYVGDNIIWHQRAGRPATRECRACSDERRRKARNTTS